MYRVQTTDYGVGVIGNYRGGHLQCQVLKAPQYVSWLHCKNWFVTVPKFFYHYKIILWI